MYQEIIHYHKYKYICNICPNKNLIYLNYTLLIFLLHLLLYNIIQKCMYYLYNCMCNT